MYADFKKIEWQMTKLQHAFIINRVGVSKNDNC